MSGDDPDVFRLGSLLALGDVELDLRQIRRTSERGTALAAAGLAIATLGLLLTVLLVL